MKGAKDVRVASPETRKTVSNPAGGAAVLKPYYANAVLVSGGPLLFISGQVAWDERGTIVGADDPVAQAEQTFKNLRTVLRAHGADFGDLVKVTVYVTSFDWFSELSTLREELFSENPPASAIVQVVRLVQPELLIEVDAVAVVPEPTAG
jgi:2-iminobutanoate/2-iminopropanoate deaminase